MCPIVMYSLMNSLYWCRYLGFFNNVLSICFKRRTAESLDDPNSSLNFLRGSETEYRPSLVLVWLSLKYSSQWISSKVCNFAVESDLSSQNICSRSSSDIEWLTTTGFKLVLTPLATNHPSDDIMDKGVFLPPTFRPPWRRDQNTSAPRRRSTDAGIWKGGSTKTSLLKFLQRAAALTNEIQDMFHRVKVHNKEARSQRFFWKEMDRNRAPDVLEMGVLIFGASCLLACAQEIKNLNALEHQQLFPEATKAIIENHYEDDYLESVDTVATANRMFNEVRAVYGQGRFNLCNWISNSREVLSAISPDLHSPRVKNKD